MNEIEATKEHMDALKALAQANIDISAARETLAKLKAEETDYLTSREKLALKRIDVVLEESKELVAQIDKNYAVVADYAKDIHEGGKFLGEVYAEFKELLAKKEEKDELVRKYLENEEKKVQNLRNALKLDLVAIESEKKQLIVNNETLEKDKIKLKDERGTLDRAIARLKKGKI